MRRGSPLARFAAAVRARYARGFGRRAPLTPILRRGPKPAAAMALHRHLHVGITAVSPIVHRRVERHVLAAPERAAVRSAVTRVVIVERMLTRRQRVEAPTSREVVRHVSRAPAAPAASIAPGASPPAALGPIRPPAPLAMPSASPGIPDAERLAADVIRAIDRRIIAQRERLGRV